MKFGFNFWKAMYQERQERRKRERAARVRVGLPRIDRDAPLDLRLDAIVTVNTLYGALIPGTSLIDSNSIDPLLIGADIDKYGRMEFGKDVLHRFYFAESEQEYMLQVAANASGVPYPDKTYLFMLQNVFMPGNQAEVDFYIEQDNGILGDRVVGLNIPGMADPLPYYTVWGSSGGWTNPLEGTELVYDDAVDNPMVRIFHQMGFFNRPLVENGPEKEFCLMTASYFYDNWKARQENYDRLAMLTYVGLPITINDFQVLNGA